MTSDMISITHQHPCPSSASASPLHVRAPAVSSRRTLHSHKWEVVEQEDATYEFDVLGLDRRLGLIFDVVTRFLSCRKDEARHGEGNEGHAPNFRSSSSVCTSSLHDTSAFHALYQVSHRATHDSKAAILFLTLSYIAMTSGGSAFFFALAVAAVAGAGCPAGGLDAGGLGGAGAAVVFCTPLGTVAGVGGTGPEGGGPGGTPLRVTVAAGAGLDVDGAGTVLAWLAGCAAGWGADDMQKRHLSKLRGSRMVDEDRVGRRRRRVGRRAPRKCTTKTTTQKKMTEAYLLLPIRQLLRKSLSETFAPASRLPPPPSPTPPTPRILPQLPVRHAQWSETYWLGVPLSSVHHA